MSSDDYYVPGAFPSSPGTPPVKAFTRGEDDDIPPVSTSGDSLVRDTLAANELGKGDDANPSATSSTMRAPSPRGTSTTGPSVETPSGVSATHGDTDQREEFAQSDFDTDLQVDDKPVLALSDQIPAFASGVLFMTLPPSENYSEVARRHFAMPHGQGNLFQNALCSTEPESPERYEIARVALRGLKSYLSERRVEEYEASGHEAIPRFQAILQPMARSLAEAKRDIDRATEGKSVNNEGRFTLLESAKTMCTLFEQRFSDAADKVYMARTDRKEMSAQYASRNLLTQAPRTVIDAWNTVRGLFDEIAETMHQSATRAWWARSSRTLVHRTDEENNLDLKASPLPGRKDPLLATYPELGKYDLSTNSATQARPALAQARLRAQRVLEMALQPLKADSSQVCKSMIDGIAGMASMGMAKVAADLKREQSERSTRLSSCGGAP